MPQQYLNEARRSSMDIPRPDLARKRRRKRFLLMLTAGAAFALISLGISRLKPAAPSVEKGATVIGTVKRGPMLREVRGSGTLVPEEILWIPAASAGRIEKINILPGAAVLADTVLVELNNPDLVKEVSDAELQLTVQEAQLEKTKVQLESERLTQEATVARQQGTTIVQVTHNENWAAYGHRIVRLKDGWMEK